MDAGLDHDGADNDDGNEEEDSDGGEKAAVK
jgi:hypothetical protein